MNKFYIESKAGVIMGIYEGATKEDAIAALYADDAGYREPLEAPADLIAVEVTDVDQDWEHEATLYMLENGGVLVESGPFRDYYSDMNAARAALSD